jgi:hypothetical protein
VGGGAGLGQAGRGLSEVQRWVETGRRQEVLLHMLVPAQLTHPTPTTARLVRPAPHPPPPPCLSPLTLMLHG